VTRFTEDLAAVVFLVAVVASLVTGNPLVALPALIPFGLLALSRPVAKPTCACRHCVGGGWDPLDPRP
jgi:hypothetical protein